MRDKRRSRTWLSWLTVIVLGFALVSGFVLVGGLGTSRSGVALARTGVADSTSAATSVTSSIVSGPTTSTGIVAGINTDACAGRTLAGSVILNGTPSGQVTLGLFGLLQHEMPLTRRFIDTGQRVTVTFGGTPSAPFLFQTIPGGLVDYFVAVLPSSGPITDATQLVESAILPICGTRKATVTTTVTSTVTSTSTSSTTVNLTETVTVVNNEEVVVTTGSSCSECCETAQSVITSGKVVSGECCESARNSAASAKTATTVRQHDFARHMQHEAKKVFSANFKFTGLVKVTPAIKAACC